MHKFGGWGLSCSAVEANPTHLFFSCCKTRKQLHSRLLTPVHSSDPVLKPSLDLTASCPRQQDVLRPPCFYDTTSAEVEFIPVDLKLNFFLVWLFWQWLQGCWSLYLLSGAQVAGELQGHTTTHWHAEFTHPRGRHPKKEPSRDSNPGTSWCEARALTTHPCDKIQQMTR